MIYLALGSNLGNRFQNFRTAIYKLSKYFDCKIMSHVIETEALLLEGSPESWNIPYLNMVIAGDSSLSPFELLAFVKSIEAEMGRDMKAATWSPRIIDIDIVDFHGETVTSDSLTIPHRGLRDRDFLQFLLNEIDYEIQDSMRLDLERYSPMNHYVLDPKFVGIVNVTPDSFSDGGDFFDADKAESRARALYSDGACIVEFGAQSTRPNYVEVSPSEEIKRLTKVMERCSDIDCIGIDSYFDEVVLFALEKYNIRWIDDQNARLSDDVVKKIADRNAKLVTMLHGTDIGWFPGRLKHLKNLGMKEENIILDPGIGFDKKKHDNISIIKNIGRIKEFGCEVMVGHSRKSFISSFSIASAKNRDMETVAISNFLAGKGVDYLRVHNVQDHMKFFVANRYIGV